MRFPHNVSSRYEDVGGRVGWRRTEDGVRTALEFNAVRWDEHDLAHQAGIAVYERGPSGKLREARIYDVEGPVE